MPVAILSYADTQGPCSVALEAATMSIGRSASQDIVLRGSTVSRQHALIVREGDTYTVVDQSSTHGTFLNGIRVQRAVLAAGDVLQMGSTQADKLRFLMQHDGADLGASEDSAVGEILDSLKSLRDQ